MRILAGDIDELAVTPADLSDMEFEGSPATVRLIHGGGGAETLTPATSASLHRPSGTSAIDRHYDLSGRLEPPCEATVEWDSGTCFLRVVRYHYCTLADVLTYGNEKRQSPRDLGRTEMEAFRARDVAERVCEDLCRDSFRATYRVDRTWDGPSLAHQLDWPATRVLSPGWETVGDGLVRRTSAMCGSAPTEVEYIGGRDRTVPSDIRRAVAKLAASYLTVSKVPDRAVYESTETGMTRYTLADVGSTGIPDVDAVFARHARGRWAVL